MSSMVELIGYDGGEGDDFFVGDDGAIYEVGDDGMVYEVGARRGRMRRQKRRQARRAPQQVALKKLPPVRRSSLDPSQARRQVVGIVTLTPIPGAIGGGQPGEGTVQVNIQRDFQGQRLVLSAFDTVANIEVNVAVTINQFLVGSVNQLPAGDPIGLVAFRPDAIDSWLSLSPASPGVIIRIGFQNFSPNPVVITGGIYGMTQNPD